MMTIEEVLEISQIGTKMDERAKLKKDLSVAAVKRVSDKYPDVEYFEVCGIYELSSRSANQEANRVEIIHNGFGALARPYVEYNGEKIYCIPSYYHIGEQNQDSWREEILEEGIGQEIVSMVEDELDV
jgi:hypothetical protein